MLCPILPPDTAFSRAVFTELRPVIPRHHWPADAMQVGFMVAPDGLSLLANFQDFPPQIAAQAAQTVARAKVKLVLASPAAFLAQRMVQARRWRDTFLYGLLPLLFGIPLMAGLGDLAMQATMGLCGADALLLIVTHARVMQVRGQLEDGRFIAQIPVPGLRLKAPSGPPVFPRP